MMYHRRIRPDGLEGIALFLAPLDDLRQGLRGGSLGVRVVHEDDVVCLFAAAGLDGFDELVHRDIVSGGVGGVYIPVIVQESV